MTLSEIETLITDLSKRHANLDKTLLTTILEAAGWEQKNIKDAIVLFVAMEKSGKLQQISDTKENIPSANAVSKTNVEPVQGGAVNASPGNTQNTSIVIAETKEVSEYKEETHALSEIPKEEVMLKEDLKKQDDVVKQKESETPHSQEEMNSPESLIIHDESVKVNVDKIAKAEIPANLPLQPFESSPHVWSFARYKDTFHKDEETPATPKPEAIVIQAPPVIQVAPPVVIQSAPAPIIEEKKIVEDEEISVEKVEMTRGDESLVFLAGVMLLGIILILGYMYSNGRL